MNPSFIRWALLAIALAGAAFLVVWQLVDEPLLPSRVRPPASGAAAPSQSGPEAARSASSESAAASAKPVAGRLLFAFDDATLDSAETATLAELAGAMQKLKVERIDAVGHADRIGTEAYNLELSRRRAEAVKAYLVGLGIDAAVVRIEAKGEAEPLTEDGCAGLGPESRQNRALIECLQPDRRVDIDVLGPD